MAHYADVNEGALISAINSCKSSLDKGAASELVADAKAMPWDGAGARDNLIAGVENISSQLNSLSGALDSALGVANLIKNYKDIKKKLDQAKADLARLKSAKAKLQRQYNKNPTSPAAAHIKGEISKKNRSITAKKNSVVELEKQLKQLGNTLSGMGYPPV